jgi:adenylate cyclase
VQAETRRLAAIMFTDIVGFSRQMGSDEARTLRLLEVHNRLIHQAVSEHHGTVIKIMGDAFLVDFPSVVHAVQCAQEIQAQLRTHNTDKEAAEQIHVRIGIHLGDIVQRDGDVFGDGVNIASRLQTLAEPDTVCISQVVYQEVSKKLDLGAVVSLGKPPLKNITERFPVYALLPESPKGVRRVLQGQRLKLTRWRRVAQTAAATLVVVWAAVVTYRLLVPTPPTGQPEKVAPTSPQLALPLPDKPSIVILPFDNMSKDPGQDYFSNGITEVLTSDLSRISNLFVIARNTAFTYKGKAINVQEVGKELGVRYVLEGSVQKASDQVRVVAQLIDAATGGHVWSERYDRPLKDIFALHDEIVQKIVTTLRLQLTLREQGVLVRKSTDNLEAYDYWLQGLTHFIRLTKEANEQARQMFEKAVALDPRYALAYTSLGWTYFTEWTFQWNPDPQNIERALELAQKATALDDSVPSSHSLLSLIYLRKHQFEPALAEGEQAIALDPNFANAYSWHAETLIFLGRPTDALEMAKKAIRLNPRYPFWYAQTLGVAYRMMGRYDEAITAQKEVVLRNPNYFWSYTELANSYLDAWWAQQLQDPQTLERALEAARRAVALNNSSSIALSYLSLAYLSKKQYEQAAAEVERMRALKVPNTDVCGCAASALSYVGRAEEAIGMIEQALRPPGFQLYLLSFLGQAYYLAGRLEKAIPLLQQYISHYPDILSAHLNLVVDRRNFDR